jgi:hypothetical protein
MAELTYPTPLHSLSYDTGPIYLKFRKLAKDYAAITTVAVFEDQGRDFQKSAADAPQFYELIYDGLTDEDAKILDDFYNAHGIDVSFTFIEPRDDPWTGNEGNTVTGCRFAEYEKDHRLVLTTQSRRVLLVKYPV